MVRPPFFHARICSAEHWASAPWNTGLRGSGTAAEPPKPERYKILGDVPRASTTTALPSREITLRSASQTHINALPPHHHTDPIFGYDEARDLLS